MVKADLIEPVRVGLIGAGPWAAMVHAPILTAGPHTVLTGIWARRNGAAEDLAARHATVACATLEELFSSCEAVAFAVPPVVQAELALAAAARGRHLLLEKPLAGDLAAAERLAEAVDAAGVASAVVLTWRYSAGVREFLQAAPALAPVSGEGRFISDAFLGGPFATPWRLQRGPLLDLGPHVIDLLDAALGAVTDVRARGRRLGRVELTLDHHGGATSQAVLCATAGADEAKGASVAIHGSAGTLNIDCGAAVGPQTFLTMAAEFAGLVRGRPAPLAPDVHRGLHIQRILQRADDQLEANR